MATIRKQRNSERLVLVQDKSQRDSANVTAVATSGRLYLPSVTGSLPLQPTRMRGCMHEARHPAHLSAKSFARTGSGRWAIAGCRAAS